MPKHGKWKVRTVKGESLGHKLTKSRTFRKFDKSEQAIILGLILFVSFFSISYGYYQFNVFQPLFPNSGSNDPFTVIYNGTSGPVNIPKLHTYITFNGCDPTDAFCSAGQSVTINDKLVVLDYQEQGCSAPASFADSQTNTFTKIADTGVGVAESISIWTATASATGTDTITPAATACWSNWESYALTDVLSIGTTYTNQGSTLTGSFQSVFSIANRYGLVIEGASSDNPVHPCSIMTHQINSTASQTVKNDYCDQGASLTIAYRTLGLFSGIALQSAYAQNYNVTVSCNSVSNCSGSHVAIAILGTHPCIDGYFCQNAIGDTKGRLNLNPNATFPGIAISQSPIDFSSAASKELFWYETWGSTTFLSFEKPFGWFLTTNQTLATNAGYTPLNDPNVILVNEAFPFNLTGFSHPIVDYYNYQAKTSGQTLLANSGADEDPLPGACPQTGTLYICARGNVVNVSPFNFRDFSMTMNYTGRTAGSASTNGQSLTCSDDTPTTGQPNIYDFCLNPQDTTPCKTNAYVCGTNVFPYLNVNNGPYYLGFWSSPGQNGGIHFGTGRGTFAENANAVFVWVPGACDPNATPPITVNCVQTTTDTGGFLGWLGHSIGTAFSVAGNFLGSALGPAFNIAGSLMGAVLSAFVQAVSQLIQVYRVILNFIGNLFGFGNIGDLLVNTLLAIGALIVNGFSAIIGFFLGLGSLITSGYFTFLAGGALLIGTLLPLAIALWKIIFNGAFTVTDILFFDYVLGIFMVFHAIEQRKSALKAFLGWAYLNVFLFTFLFNAAWTIFDIVTRPIHRTKQTVDPVG